MCISSWIGRAGPEFDGLLVLDAGHGSLARHLDWYGSWAGGSGTCAPQGLPLVGDAAVVQIGGPR